MVNLCIDEKGAQAPVCLHSVLLIRKLGNVLLRNRHGLLQRTGDVAKEILLLQKDIAVVSRPNF